MLIIKNVLSAPDIFPNRWSDNEVISAIRRGDIAAGPLNYWAIESALIQMKRTAVLDYLRAHNQYYIHNYSQVLFLNSANTRASLVNNAKVQLGGGFTTYCIDQCTHSTINSSFYTSKLAGNFYSCLFRHNIYWKGKIDFMNANLHNCNLHIQYHDDYAITMNNLSDSTGPISTLKGIDNIIVYTSKLYTQQEFKLLVDLLRDASYFYGDINIILLGHFEKLEIPYA